MLALLQQNRRLVILLAVLTLLVLLALLASMTAFHALHPITLHHLQRLADDPNVIVHNH